MLAFAMAQQASADAQGVKPSPSAPTLPMRSGPPPQASVRSPSPGMGKAGQLPPLKGGQPQSMTHKVAKAVVTTTAQAVGSSVGM